MVGEHQTKDYFDTITQAAALSAQLQQTSARGAVLAIPAEVIGQAGNTLVEKRYLHFRGAGVARLALVLSADGSLAGPRAGLVRRPNSDRRYRHSTAVGPVVGDSWP